MLHAYQKPLFGSNVGVVFGSFAPLHQGHLDLIFKAKKENDAGCIVIVCGYEGDKGNPLMPMKKRYRYVREFFADDDLVSVYSINDSELNIPEYPDGWDTWIAEFNRIYQDAIDSRVLKTISRTWYVGDRDYNDGLTNLEERAVLVDRTKNSISGTMIRCNPIEHWNKIAYPFRRFFSTNILITGTASEGKSTLVKDLGKYFNAPYSYEWARDYMRDSCVSDWELDGADYLAFLEGQHALNKRLINSPANGGVFFADTDSMVTRMYAEYYAKDNKCELTIDEFENIAKVADELTRKCRWDKIFLLCPHGTFIDDHTRFMAHAGMRERQELFTILCNNIKTSGNWDKTTILDGGYYKNFTDIISYVKGVMVNGKI